MYVAPALPKGKLPRLPRPCVANHMSPVGPVGRLGLHRECRWLAAVTITVTVTFG